jgi:hypothetical protein
MNLYLISQSVNNDYDTYDSAVVCVEDEIEASKTHPSGYEWDGGANEYRSWCDYRDVRVKLIGMAINGTEKGVICASYNAG